MHITLAALASRLEGEVVGEGQTIITGLAPLDQAQAGDLSFLTESKYAAKLPASSASAVLIPPQTPVDRPAIRVTDPYLSFIQLLEQFYPLQPAPSWGIDPRAILAEDVECGEGLNIGPYVVIESGVRLGREVTIYPGTYIGAGCEVGEGCILYANVSLYPRVHLGRGVIVHSGAVLGADGFGFHPLPDGSYRKIPQVGRVVVGDGVEIGANTCIDRAMIGDTIIAAGAKLDNLVQIGHNSVVGAHSVLAGQAGLSGSVRLGAGVRVGGQVGIADHLSVGDNVSIAAQAGVINDLEAGATVYGSPALPGPVAKRRHLYSLRLGEVFQQVKELQRRLDAFERREKTP
ncbi:MAG: UDP-3-O-(3-hydroxymyristoyl)glucosamine N-acyltransferase [Candidatus Tectimicrobiota bacterium]